MLLAKLKKMKMPEKKGEDMSHMEEGSPEEESMESPEEESSESEEGEAGEGQETPQEEAKELELVSDDDLIAELKKRGLMSKLNEESAQGSDDEIYS